MNPIWIGMFDIVGPTANPYLEGNAGAFVWIAAQGEDASKLRLRAESAVAKLGLTVMSAEEVQEVIDEAHLAEHLAGLIPEARQNEESVVFGNWHRYKNHDA